MPCTNPRGIQQIKTLGEQCFPSRGQILEEACEDCIKYHYGNLVIALYPHSDRDYRLVILFADEDTIVYQAL